MKPINCCELIKTDCQLPIKGQWVFYNNKVWKVSERHGTSIIHLQRPKHQEAISLFGEQIFKVKTLN